VVQFHNFFTLRKALERIQNQPHQNQKPMTFDKEYFLKLLTQALDGQAQLRAEGFTRGGEYADGIKHVRGLFDETFDETVAGEDLLEFSVSLICSIQPEDPQHNRNLTGMEQGILAGAYFLYSAMQPLLVAGPMESPKRFGGTAGEWPSEG